LSQRQIDYALGDVTHLRVAYEKLARKLSANGHESWLSEEMAVLNNPDTYTPDPALVFRRLKVRNPSRRTLALLRELAAWRELEARRVDVPRNRVLRDEALLEIAHHAPATIDDLKRTRGLGRRMAEGPAGQAILEAVQRGQAVPDADCPRTQSKPALPRGLGPVIDLLKVLLKMKCEENQVAQKLVASAADVERIAADGETADVPALSGWRRQVFGEDALALRSGATALAADGKRLKLVLMDRS
jgi:ribonuclease D